MGILSSIFGCRKPPATDASTTTVVVITNDAQHNQVYKRGTELISPHMQLLDKSPKVTKTARDEVSQGIQDLDAVTAYDPQNWAAFWVKGKGYQVLGNHEAANSEFRKSFDIQKQNPDVAREYASSCLELGFGAEAIRATLHAIQLAPEDAGLHANLALAFLIDGQNTEAKKAIQKSLEMSPHDKISQAVQRMVDEVIAGKRKQPKTMADLIRS